jgi:hypothetical protein
MPSWVVLLALAIVSWLTVAIGGGLLVGRLLDAVSRLHRPARRAAAEERSARK